jgi:hypothetical protein
MSYGLYISDGVNGGVITNNNTIFNEEYGSELTQLTLNAGTSYTITVPGAGNSGIIGIAINASDDAVDKAQITRNSSADTLTITNIASYAITLASVKLFRFQ